MKSNKNTSTFTPVFLLLVRDIIFLLNQKNNGVNSSLPIGKRQNLWYNKEKKLINVKIMFDNLNEETDTNYDWYVVQTEIDSKLVIIDENTFSTELYLRKGNDNRLDSFDAIITMSHDGKIDIKSTDGKYIIRGTVEDFVPQWQWSEEQRNAPVPQVVMIDE